MQNNKIPLAARAIILITIISLSSLSTIIVYLTFGKKIVGAINLSFESLFMRVGIFLLALILLKLLFFTVFSFVIKYTGLARYIIMKSLFHDSLAKRLDFLEQQKNKMLARVKKQYEISQGKNSYVIQGVTFSEKSYQCIISFDKKIKNQIMPLVTCNERILGLSIHGYTHALGYIRDMLNSNTQKLTFTTAISHIEVNNPFYFQESQVLPTWQCEGHDYERKIFIPKDYFPNMIALVPYEFRLKIGNKNIGYLTGRFNPDASAIVISLGKLISKESCVGYQVSLSLDWDPTKKILLPEPTVISINGKKC